MGVAADTVSGTFSSGGTVTTGFEGRFVLVTDDAGASWTSIECGLALPDDFRWSVTDFGYQPTSRGLLDVTLAR